MDGTPLIRERGSLRRALLAWFDRERRELPWRGGSDAWGVLVSEIMLQQTTVAAVVPYYERFMQRWPRAADLARCDDDELSAAWAGLGYYRRARMLKQAATAIVEGGMPTDLDALRALPGVGEYTAAAVASIALQLPAAAVDGNVERVLCRLLAWPHDPRRAATRRALREVAAALLAPRRPGDFNQAMMELGATVCRPRAPRCGSCAVQRFCAAHAEGAPERYPPPPTRRPWLAVTRVAALMLRRGRLALVRREAEPNQGFLELPGRELRPSELADDDAPLDAGGALREHLERAHGLRAGELHALRPHRHVITRHRIVVLPHRVEGLAGRARGGLVWVDPRAPATPLTTATRRIVERHAPDLLDTTP